MLAVELMIRPLLVFFFAAHVLSAATLQRLSLTEMIQKSTEIVIAKVARCSPVLKSGIVFTTCRLSVSEQWKGAARAETTVSIPGGITKNIQQSFAGAPSIKTGDQFLFFLWTGPSGMTQIIGFSQGLLSIEQAPDGTLMAVRTPIRDRMLDTTGKPVWDEGIDIPLARLRQTVGRAAN